LISQQFVLDRPDLARKLVLVGTGPRAGEGMQPTTKETIEIFSAKYEHPEDLWMKAHFTSSEASQAAGRAFIKRKLLRQEGRDPEVNETVAPAQMAALEEYGKITEDRYSDLKKIKVPTLVINGDRDVIVHAVNSYILQQNLPNAKLILYPDANHGSLFQYPEEFVNDVNYFLNK
jgi:pimeloyl-ACP methyl ester carboxylesterase